MVRLGSGEEYGLLRKEICGGDGGRRGWGLRMKVSSIRPKGNLVLRTVGSHGGF